MGVGGIGGLALATPVGAGRATFGVAAMGGDGTGAAPAAGADGAGGGPNPGAEGRAIDADIGMGGGPPAPYARAGEGAAVGGGMG